jgi:hypothetical protein
MTSGFLQQNPMQNVAFPRTDALPQHGQQPDKSCMKKTTADRKPKVRPGH